MDRGVLQKHLVLAARHVEEGERHIRQQRQRIAELQRDGHNTMRACEFLTVLEETLATHKRLRDRLRDAVSAGDS